MKAPSTQNKRTLVVMLIVILTVFLILIGRLFWLQVVQAAELQAKALDQWTRELPVTATRGKILDCNNQVLAQSGTTYMVLLRPKNIKKTDKERVATELANLLGLDKGKVLEKANDETKSEIILARQIEREVVEKLDKLNLGTGVATSLDVKRYYPLRTLLAQTIGFTNIDGDGQEGLELIFNKYLAGEDGSLVNETDRDGESIAYGTEEYIEPIDGYNLVLTIDSEVQSFLENAMEEALAINKAENAQGIVMNPKTGEILAIAVKPDYDLNALPRDDLATLTKLMRNRVVTDAYEPGSTFKIVTLASGLDAGVINMNSSFYCPGYRIVDGERIKCWSSRSHGSETLADGVKNSCNPVFMDIAIKLGKEKFYDYIYKFGLGSSTESGIAGEARGIVSNIKYIRNVDLARIGFGQSIAVTPIQLATAACAAINGGNLMKPYIVKSITDNDGNTISTTQPTVVRRVISEDTSGKVRELLENVVKNGSGRNAQIAGYRVGGKTGTAQKYENGQIAQGKLVASFVGFAPADNPELLCLILIDEPKVGVIFGSTVAAPFVKIVMEDCLKHYGFKPNYTEEEKQAKTVTVPDLTDMNVTGALSALIKVGLTGDADAGVTGKVTAQLPAAGTQVARGSTVLLYTNDQTATEETEKVEVPYLLGKTKLNAYDALKELGLKMNDAAVSEQGTVISQSPAAGTKVNVGSTITLKFGKPDI